MPIEYKDIFYNHFEKRKFRTPPHYSEHENFLMRYKARFEHYEFHQNCLTVIYFKEGRGEFVSKASQIKAKDGHFMVLNPNDGWEFINPRNQYIDVLSFGITSKLLDEGNTYLQTRNEKLLDNPYYNIRQESFFLEKDLKSEYYTSGRLLKYIHNFSGYEEYKLTSAEELTIEVIKSLYREQVLGNKITDKINAKKISTREETLKRLLVAYEYIHDNIEHPITIEHLSQISSLSRFHLFDSFKKAFGKTPHQYINRLKISKAKKMLQKEDIPIGELSDLFGFSDLSVFSKAFKKTYGKSPSYFSK